MSRPNGNSTRLWREASLNFGTWTHNASFFTETKSRGQKMYLQCTELERRDFFSSLHMSGQILQGISSSWMTRKQRPCLDNWHSSSSQALFPFLPRCQVHIHDTLNRAPPLAPSLSALASIHQSCNPVVFAERIRTCPLAKNEGKVNRN